MEFGRAALPEEQGVLLYHDAVHEIERRIPGAMPAWRWLPEPPIRRLD